MREGKEFAFCRLGRTPTCHRPYIRSTERASRACRAKRGLTGASAPILAAALRAALWAPSAAVVAAALRAASLASRATSLAKIRTLCTEIYIFMDNYDYGRVREKTMNPLHKRPFFCEQVRE